MLEKTNQDIGIDESDAEENWIENDPDFILGHYKMNGDLVREFRDKKVSASARLAFDYIVLNASSVRCGVSRPIDINGLIDFLQVKRARVYKIIAKLEAKGFIEPRNKNARWTYDISALSDYEKKYHEYLQRQRDEKKAEGARKKAEGIESKIAALAKIFNKPQGFSSAYKKELVNRLSTAKSIKDVFNALRVVLHGPMTTEQQELVKTKFTEIDNPRK